MLALEFTHNIACDKWNIEIETKFMRSSLR